MCPHFHLVITLTGRKWLSLEQNGGDLTRQDGYIVSFAAYCRIVSGTVNLIIW
jgi:hypothetical protein